MRFPLLNAVLANRSRLDAELGRRGMDVVYRAHATVPDRAVAMKVPSASSLGTAGKTRLLADAQAAAKLDHQNIVWVFEAGDAGSAPFSPRAFRRPGLMAFGLAHTAHAQTSISLDPYRQPG